jgi:predicted O-methyltransferase YrrM
MDYVSVTAGHRRWLAVDGWLSARQGEPIEGVESQFADDSLDVVFIDGDHRYVATRRE